MMNRSPLATYLAVLSAGVIVVAATACSYAWFAGRDHLVEERGRALRYDLQENALDLSERLNRSERMLWRWKNLIVDEMSRTEASGASQDRGLSLARTTPFGEFEKTVSLGPDDDAGLPSKELEAIEASARILDGFGPASMSLVDSIWFYSRSGGATSFEVAGMRGTMDAYRSGDRQFAKLQLSGGCEENPSRRLQWSRPRYDRFSKEWIVSAVIPVDVAESWLGNVGADLRVSTLYRELASINTDYIDLVIGANRHVIAPTGSEIESSILPGSEMAGDEAASFTGATEIETIAQVFSAATSAGYGRVTVDGGPHLAASQKISRLDWTVLRLLPQLAGKADVLARRIALAGIGGSLVVIALGYVAARWLIRTGGSGDASSSLLQPALLHANEALAALRREPHRAAVLEHGGDHHAGALPFGHAPTTGLPASQAAIGFSSSGVTGQVLGQGLCQILVDVCEEISREAQRLGVETRGLRHDLRRLQDVVEKRGLYLGYLSHDLRTQLNSVVGFAEMMRASGVSGSNQVYLNYVIESAHIAVRRLNFALGASSAEEEALNEEAGVCEIRALIESAMVQVEEYAARRGITLKVTRAEENHGVHCRKGAITNVLRIIAMNAVGRCERNGLVSVECQIGESDLLIWCRDDGGYLSPIEVQRMMKPTASDLVFIRTKIDMDISSALEIVVALGGTFEATSPPGGLLVRASIPIVIDEARSPRMV